MSVYFVEVGKDGLMVKIGVSGSPRRRTKQLAYQFGEPVTLVAVMEGGGVDEELELHNRFAADLVFLQGELFHKSQAIIDLMTQFKCEPYHFEPVGTPFSKIAKKRLWDSKAAEEYVNKFGNPFPLWAKSE